MTRPLERLLLPALLLAGLALGAVAQEPGAKKEDGKKTEPAKSKDNATGKASGEKWAFPPGTIIVVPKDFEKGLPTWPGVVIQRLEDYQKLREAADKAKAKADKKLAHSCELTGRLDGDYVSLRGELTFATEEPRTTVVLGLQGGLLTEKGDLDGKVPLMDYAIDDGFTARVDEPGNHRLVLHLRVPVKTNRPASGSGVERTLDMGLPGTVITTIALELPTSVKEVRCYETIEKTRVPGKWLFAVGKRQTLSLAWREPAAQLGGGPHLTVEGKIKMDLLGPDADVRAELELVDPRGQTRECQLVVPAQADIKVEPPPGLSYELLPPGPKNPNHILRFAEPNTEPWKVTAFVRLPRPAPGGRLPVGPFFVPGAKQQRGTITIAAPAELLRKQRLIYYRHGEVFQRDPPKGQDIEALFQYWRLPDPGAVKGSAGSRVPLEIEIKSERGALEAAVEQVLKLRPSGERWEIDLAAQVNVKSPGSGGDFLDVQLPRPRPVGMALLAGVPGGGLAGTVPWAALAMLRGPWPVWAVPLEFQLSDEAGGVLDLPVPDGHGRCRLPLPRGLGKGLILKLTGKYVVAADNRRVRVDLPRLLGLVEQGSKVTVQADESLELLDGPPGWEVPVQENHRYRYPVDATPAFVDVAWRPYRPEFPATALVDVVMRGRTAQVRERLRYGPPPRPGLDRPSRLGQVELQVPAGVQGLTAVHGGERTPLTADPRTGTVWLPPRGEDVREVVLEYDVPLVGPIGDVRAESRTLEVRIIWPRRATRQQAKVRLWSEPGARLRLVDGGRWRDRGVEAVKDHDVLPALVLEADGTELPLALVIDAAAGSRVAPLVCERGLIAVDVGDDGGLACRARYVVSKANADAIEVEFPADIKLCKPTVRFGDHGISWQPVDGNDRAIRVPLAAGGVPLVLEIGYLLPKATQEGRVFGLVTLVPPVLGAPVRHLRWHVNLPAGDVVAMPLTPGARPEYRWALSRWLLSPEPAAADADLEAWLLGNGAGGDTRPHGLTFFPAGQEPQRVYFVPRLLWLVAVSVLAVVVFLVVYFLRLSRALLVALVGLAVVAGLALALTWPALLVALCYGAEPGLVVVVLVLLLLWVWQERYRRQLVFIPGFTRLQAGSSLIRNGKSSRRPREASTVDAPAPSGVAGAESGSKK
jgi:hypothetical protein